MTMTTRHALATFVLASALTAAAAVPLAAQDKPPAAPVPPTVPAKVEVVLSRFQGDKKVASQPYVLMPTASPRGDGYVNLRIGVDVPVGTKTTTRPAEGNREGQTVTSPQYQNVGTNIDCRVTSMADGRFSVYVSVTDSSIFNPDSPQTAGKPSENSAIRTFQASNTLTMRDGQTMLLITATDKVTGELVKIEVMFSVLK